VSCLLLVPLHKEGNHITAYLYSHTAVYCTTCVLAYFSEIKNYIYHLIMTGHTLLTLFFRNLYIQVMFLNF
jgi:hypothetical protein